MTREEIKERLYEDVEFIYNGKGAAFIEWCFAVGYDNEAKDFETLDEAIDAPVFDGKSLVDIWDEITPQIY